MMLLLSLALAGCGGHRDAPLISLPPGTAIAPDAAAQRAPRNTPYRGDSSVPAESFLPSDGPPPVAQDLPPEVAQGQGPRGTSGEMHEDAVGYAAALSEPPQGRWANVAIGVGHPTLPEGTLVELTALDTGRTIVAMVVARSDGAVVALSPAAAQALGVGDHAGVRVRSVAASPQDQLALRSGRAASPRLDAPPALVAALRRKLPNARPIARTPDRPMRPALADGALPVAHAVAPRPRTAPAPLARGGFIVQIAALSSGERAAALAQQLGGRVVPLGKLYRVQLGPFADAASAQRARDGAARRGYADARISHTD